MPVPANARLRLRHTSRVTAPVRSADRRRVLVSAKWWLMVKFVRVRVANFERDIDIGHALDFVAADVGYDKTRGRGR